jgi:hypothetical protein
MVSVTCKEKENQPSYNLPILLKYIQRVQVANTERLSNEEYTHIEDGD